MNVSKNPSLRVHFAVEYIKHISSFKDDGFFWSREDVLNEIHAVMAYYGLWVDEFETGEIELLQDELMELVELSENREISRLVAEIEC